jgi:CrcB protein
MFKQFLLVGIGGATGSMLRYLTSILTARYFTGRFPLSTFITNIAGCFLIGLLMGALVENNSSNQQLRLLLVTGFCGGYTTFSAFSYENMILLTSNNSLVAIGYIFASVFLGILAVWLGLNVS